MGLKYVNKNIVNQNDEISTNLEKNAYFWGGCFFFRDSTLILIYTNFEGKRRKNAFFRPKLFKIIGRQKRVLIEFWERSKNQFVLRENPRSCPGSYNSFLELEVSMLDLKRLKYNSLKAYEFSQITYLITKMMQKIVRKVLLTVLIE